MNATMTAEQALAEMLKVIDQVSLADLARLAAHEYDDEAVVPDEGSDGAALLIAGRDAFVAWVRQHGRFPTEAEAEEPTTNWWAQAQATQIARAFVDLGLYFSHHADRAQGASPHQLQKVVCGAAEQLAVALTEEYGPLV